MNIYVGNLPFVITDDSLSAMFKEFGEIESAKVIMDRFTNRSKGFGFVEMPNNSEADQAIKALNGKLVEGKNIKVNPANPGGKKQTGKRQKKPFNQRRY